MAPSAEALDPFHADSAALLHGKSGGLYLAADDEPLTRQQICVEACQAPSFAGRKVPNFTGTDGGVGKVVDSSGTRAELRWEPQYKTFRAFISTLT